MEPIFFRTPAEFRAWLAEHHTQATELLVGFYKTSAPETGITWPQAVDEALCFGWIDGIRKSLDATRYTIRFTPRKRSSNWSAVNIKRVGELTALGRMQPAGLRAFAERDPAKDAQYTYERDVGGLDDALEAEFRAHPAAWDFFQAQAPSYRRTASAWVMSAKQEATRRKRLATLMDDSANGRRLAQLTKWSGREKA